MLANIFSLQITFAHKWGQNVTFFFSESSNVAYQINMDEANKYLHTLDPWMVSKDQNNFILKVILHIKLKGKKFRTLCSLKYLTLCIPLTFCIIYGSARKSYLQMLDPIHNQGLRLALGAFRTSPVASLYVEADEPSLNSRSEKHFAICY